MLKYLPIFFGMIFQVNMWAQNGEMATVRGGSYLPLYGADKPVKVEGFKIDKHPVTNKEFLEFVKNNPRWRRSQVKRLFADENYLTQWNRDTEMGEDMLPNSPVTSISWYAAKSYCECQGKRLPTMDEWEYVAMASENQPDGREREAYNKYILNWYETPNTFNNEVGKTYENYWGVWDMFGLVWEWTQDFNSVMITGDSRKGSKGDTDAFCGAAALGASDLMDYAAFIRYAFRGSLKANYAIKNLGFRCAQDI